MKKQAAVAALAALANDNRLDVYRVLVQAGPEGMSAGSIARRQKLASSTLTFHFDRLRDAGLVTARRNGRSMIYAARYDKMYALLAYLTENCCQGERGQVRDCGMQGSSVGAQKR
jgi:ArsR family transcriptional regulator, arsenate/arsenite/antimonite-responsive transcriptional repressor